MNERYELYQSCSARVKYNSRDISRIDFSGMLNATVVFRPSSFSNVVLVLSCDDAEGEYEYVIDEMPKNFDEYIDIGTVVLTGK